MALGLPRCLCWNVHSLAANITTRKNNIATLLQNFNVDIAFISETRLKKTRDTDLQCCINGFDFYRQDRVIRKGSKLYGGGVALWIRVGLAVRRWLPSAHRIGTPRAIECLFVEVDYQGRKLMVVSVYVPLLFLCAAQINKEASNAGSRLSETL
jgi:exonuclease III